MNNPSIKEIVLKYCTDNGYTGIVNLSDSDGCGCPLEDFPLCECYDENECKAGYKHKDKSIYLEPETEIKQPEGKELK